MSEKAELVTKEIVDFLDHARGSGRFTADELQDFNRWQSYAQKAAADLGVDALSGKLSPAEHERRLEKLADEVIGTLGQRMLPGGLVEAATAHGMDPVSYAARAFRGGRS